MMTASKWGVQATRGGVSEARGAEAARPGRRRGRGGPAMRARGARRHAACSSGVPHALCRPMGEAGGGRAHRAGAAAQMRSAGVCKGPRRAAEGCRVAGPPRVQPRACSGSRGVSQARRKKLLLSPGCASADVVKCAQRVRRVRTPRQHRSFRSARERRWRPPPPAGPGACLRAARGSRRRRQKGQ
ncbi:MAG: hypothetical protein J3K34DRAFT_120827 [Monoraphidium minutum]|nr:MAG: hypothetical protein J3K34DRAFT_120827 [Monoraphidium minutum]